MVTPVSAVRYVLETPAETVSVGQEIAPRIVNLSADTANFQVQWLEGSHVRSSEVGSVEGDSAVDLAPVRADETGAFELRSQQVDAPHPERTTQTVAINAVAEPLAGLGGVELLDAAGLSPDIVDYLRAHGFAVNDLDGGAPPASNGLIVVGDPRLGGGAVGPEYSAIWTAVGNGANLLLLEPPPPAVAGYWPVPLQPAPPAPMVDVFPPVSPRVAPLETGLQAPARLPLLLRPVATYNVGPGSGAPDIYAMAGARWLAPDSPPLFCFRFGSGWVTVSGLPLLAHFADADVRRYVMNLLKAAAEPQRRVGDAPGIVWVMQKRLAQLEKTEGADSGLASFYVPPPAALEPAPEFAPALSDGDPATCITEPQRAAMAVEGELAGPAAPTQWRIQAESWPTDYVVEMSATGKTWQAVTTPATPSGAGAAVWRVPAAPFALRLVRVRVLADAPGHHWSICEIAPSVSEPATAGAR